MLSAFGDESTDQTKQRVFVVAALLGDENAWQEFAPKWEARLAGKIFHAADCESGRGEFRDIDETQCKQLHRDLTETLASSGLFGYGAAMDLAGVRQFAGPVLDESPDMPYFDCFLRVVKYMADLAAVFVPADRLKFTFDQQKPIQYNAGLLYTWITQYKPVVIEGISFATRKYVGIQAADLWARELMKRCDSVLLNPRSNPRPQWQSLMSRNRFKFELVRGSDLARGCKEAEEKFRIDQEAYERWRTENRIVDNLSNRFRYFAQVESARHEKKQ